MKIRLLTFASASDAVGTSELEVSLPAGSSVAALRAELDRRFPNLKPLWPRLAIAVDGELVSQEAPLADGAEVALLPPVSGGSTGFPNLPAVALVDGPIDLPGLLSFTSRPSCGAAVLFVGNVRNHHRGRPVRRITYHAYHAMAERVLQTIVDALQGQEVELSMAIHHRLGEIAVGEASVVIAVTSPHRTAAYDASRIALERLKAEAPIWKREHYADGEVAWREEETLAAQDP